MRQIPDQNLPETVYTPEPVLRRPGVLFGQMWRDLLASRELAWRLFIRNISAAYRQTLLGYLWAFLPPLVTSASFLLLQKGGVFDPGETRVPTAAFLLIGTSLWQLFVDSVNAPLRVARSSRAMLIKLSFPRESLLLAGVMETVFGFLIRSLIIAGTMIAFQIAPPITILLVPLGLLLLLMMGTVIGVLLTPVGLLYEDVSKALPMLMGFWMLLTPVVYAPAEHGLRGALLKFNPAAPVLSATRDWLVIGETTHTLSLVIIAAATLFISGFGWMMFRLAMPHIIARMGG